VIGSLAATLNSAAIVQGLTISPSTRPRVSVLMPCYNCEKYLEEALQSIADQTFASFEIVFVNDGSTDSSLAIARRFAGTDTRMIIIDQANGGIVTALNAGLAVCRGEYVARMDADDVSFPDRLGYQVDYMDSNPGCVIVGGLAVNNPTMAGATIKTRSRSHRRTNLRLFPPKVASALHPLIMIRRRALVAIGGYRAGFAHAEDYDLYIRLRAHGTIDNPRKHVLFYRRHEAAISIRFLEIQEQAAAAAEYDAMRGDGIALPPEWLCQPYLRLRIWRRYQDGAPDKARAMRATMLGDLLNLHPRTLICRRYFRLRLLILAATLRWATRRSSCR